MSRSRRPQHPVHAQILSRLAEQGEQRMGQHGQQEQRVSPVMAFDDGRLESQSNARVLHVPASLLHREAPRDHPLPVRAVYGDLEIAAVFFQA